METEDWTIVHMSNALAANKTVIDALVAALEEVRPTMARSTHSGIPGSHAEARLARIDAALALARKGG